MARKQTRNTSRQKTTPSKSRRAGIDFESAIERLHHTGSRLMVMTGRTGDEFYIIPGSRIGHGGLVERTAAEQILARDDIIKFDDGLFPGNPQSWKMVRV